MKTLITFILITLIAITTPLSARGPSWQGGNQGGSVSSFQWGNNYVSEPLTVGEHEHLIYMREEEKLARDVYITLGQMYPRSRVFGNIASSEEKHTTAVKRILDKYSIEDPVTNDNVGVFTGDKYGDYFSATFDALIDRGSVSNLEALYVGAYIEELDILDINKCDHVILDRNEELNYPEDCGLESTTKSDLQRMLGSLLSGSENHLRAFVQNIERHIGYGNYQAQVISQEEVDDILGR